MTEDVRLARLRLIADRATERANRAMGLAERPETSQSKPSTSMSADEWLSEAEKHIDVTALQSAESGASTQPRSAETWLAEAQRQGVDVHALRSRSKA